MSKAVPKVLLYALDKMPTAAVVARAGTCSSESCFRGIIEGDACGRTNDDLTVDVGFAVWIDHATQHSTMNQAQHHATDRAVSWLARFTDLASQAKPG